MKKLRIANYILLGITLILEIIVMIILFGAVVPLKNANDISAIAIIVMLPYYLLFVFLMFLVGGIMFILFAKIKNKIEQENIAITDPTLKLKVQVLDWLIPSISCGLSLISLFIVFLI